jgi:hypothetical protein
LSVAAEVLLRQGSGHTRQDFSVAEIIVFVRLFAVIAVVLVGCTSARSANGASEPELVRPGLQARALFEAVRAHGGFTPDAYAVWTPLWPTKDDSLLVLYDLRAGPLGGGSSLELVVRPEQGEPRVRQMSIENGVALLKVKAAEVAPGRFGFRSGAKVDDACGNPQAIGLVPLTPVWQRRASEHFIYQWLPDDPVGVRVDQVLERLEQKRRAVLLAADLEDQPEQITFVHYKDRDTGFVYQAHHGNNADWSRGLVFSAEDEDDAHELTHLLFDRRVGRHVGFFDEGAAIWFGQAGKWWGKPCDQYVSGDLPPLRSLLTPEQMYAQPWKVVGGSYYPAACSFTGYAVKKYGAPRLKLFLGSYDCESQHDSAKVEAAFEKAFGAPLADVDREWRAAVGQKH